MSGEWWKEDECELFELENDESGITVLYGRETPNGWEYAIVRWVRQSAKLINVFKNGTRLQIHSRINELNSN